MKLFKLKENNKSCNDIINVKDIRNNFLYTKDNKIMCYIKIEPLNLDLLSNKEKLLEKGVRDYTEIKFENTIDRLTAVANPRQNERVPAGAEFTFKLIYNIEDESQLEEDLNNLKIALDLLVMDYLGGHGTRGYGRVDFLNWTTEIRDYANVFAIAQPLCESTFGREQPRG